MRKKIQSSSSLRKSFLAAHQNLSDFLNGSRIEGQKSKGRACLWSPWERKWRTETTEQRARLLLRKPGHPASPSQGPLDTFLPAALGKQARHCEESLSVCVLGEYGLAPSTGCSIRIHFVWTSSKHIPKERLQSGLQQLHTVCTVCTDGVTECPWRNKMPHMRLGAADWTSVFASTNQNVSSWQVLKAVGSVLSAQFGI